MTRLTPRSPIVKKLLALSSNECAYESCTTALVQEGMFVGDIAHIHAASQKGPRYMPEMSDEDRRSFDNLMILCLTHHRLIDSKKLEKKYPAELLKEMKQSHEARASAPYDFTDDVLRQVEEKLLIEATQNNSLTSGVQYNTQTIVHISGDSETRSTLDELAKVASEEDGEEEDDEGILDKIADAEAALPLWNKTIEEMGSEIKVLGSVMQDGVLEIQRSDKLSKGLSGRREVMRKVAHNLGPVTSSIQHLGEEYRSQFLLVNSGIEAILDLAEMQPEQYKDFKDFLDTILYLVESSNTGIGQVGGLLENMKPVEVLSKDMKRVLHKVRVGLGPSIDSLPKMNVWADRIHALETVAKEVQ